jgi:transposase InsO family protein
MAYSINPCLPKARQTALLMLKRDKLPINLVARKCGVHRTTVWRWAKKWQVLNRYVRTGASLRGNKPISTDYRRYQWSIPTLSSRPHTSPKSLPTWVVERVIELRRTLNRCAVVIYAHCQLEQVPVSLTSIKRILKRYGLLRPVSKWKRYRRYSKRPIVMGRGDLVQTDTIHYVHPISKTRCYIYTVIDLYSRMAYAHYSTKLSQELAVQTILSARQSFGFNFKVVQSDNGPEFGKWFNDRLVSKGMAVRHSRVRRPNDNAHIERFNSTIQDECLGSYIPDGRQHLVASELARYLDYYNNHRLHLSLQCQTPASVAKVVG